MGKENRVYAIQSESTFVKRTFAEANSISHNEIATKPSASRNDGYKCFIFGGRAVARSTIPPKIQVYA